MKRLFTLFLIANCQWNLFAEDFNLYYVSTQNETNVKVEAVKQLKKVTFENGNMVVTMTDGTTKTVSLSVVQRLVFFTESGLVGIQDTHDTAPANNKHQVYDLTGRLLGNDIDVAKLPKGTYVIDGKKTLIR
ncbi:MAG: hypothetical protein K2O61_01560 [Bacteroidaceae bacterium]|nr:hypothetical protein [Bacteroidaceae bacterium]